MRIQSIFGNMTKNTWVQSLGYNKPNGVSSKFPMLYTATTLGKRLEITAIAMGYVVACFLGLMCQIALQCNSVTDSLHILKPPLLSML